MGAGGRRRHVERGGHLRRDCLTYRLTSNDVGKALTGSTLGEFWKYRVGEYRIIASIEDHALCVLVVKIGNRREVYR